jgi:hypothetical protein
VSRQLDEGRSHEPALVLGGGANLVRPVSLSHRLIYGLLFPVVRGGKGPLLPQADLNAPAFVAFLARRRSDERRFRSRRLPIKADHREGEQIARNSGREPEGAEEPKLPPHLGVSLERCLGGQGFCRLFEKIGRGLLRVEPDVLLVLEHESRGGSPELQIMLVASPATNFQRFRGALKTLVSQSLAD